MSGKKLVNDTFQEKVPKYLQKSICGIIFKICTTQNNINIRNLYQYKEIHLLEGV